MVLGSPFYKDEEINMVSVPAIFVILSLIFLIASIFTTRVPYWISILFVIIAVLLMVL